MHKNYSINIPLQRHLLKPVTLLFIQQDENQRVKRVTHAHPFWQLEYIIADTIEIKSGKSKKPRPEDGAFENCCPQDGGRTQFFSGTF